jgi:large subunit ribosomal protein L13
MTTKTKAIKASEIKRLWHLKNAEGKILGRLATKVAFLLMGKNKPYFVNHLDCGDYVVVINAARIQVSGRKKKQKIYYRHSGYPGGFKEISFEEQMKRDPRKIIRDAVSGMLPKNKLRDKRLARLKIFVDGKHPYAGKFKIKKSKSPAKGWSASGGKRDR